MNSKYKYLFEIVISFVIAFAIIIIFFSKEENFENLALGKYTKPYFAKQNEFPVQTIALRNHQKIIEGIQNRNNKSIVLILGNSQSHSINQLKVGDNTFVGVLSDSLQKKSIEIIGSSVPNGNLEEFYLIYKLWQSKIKLNALVVPIFLDDTREEGIQKAFFNDIKTFTIQDSNSVAKSINKELKTFEKNENVDVLALSQTYQEKTETSLNKFLDQQFSPWHLRANVRGGFFNNLYKLRNTVFGIDARTKRGIIKEAYHKNMEALKALIADCNIHHIPILIYIPPIRNDFEIPYFRNEYDDFKKEINTICEKNGASFINIENSVSNKYWGFKGTRTFWGEADIDFMHFQYAGHLLVAKQLQPQIEKLIK